MKKIGYRYYIDKITDVKEEKWGLIKTNMFNGKEYMCIDTKREIKKFKNYFNKYALLAIYELFSDGEKVEERKLTALMLIQSYEN